ncbi:protein kinase [Streptosporangium sp. NBC_01495]|uniref:serine/threonine-protein kinase n=1 Tax=Streptosporangium sp. NBC_01495 TaxID=2903899 RepID=UPI002E31B194|nr:protein kinase [Streptosporangium sp. NBC_01495]
MVPGYREVRELGVGGGGRVVLATYAPTGAYVAIKYLNATLKDDHRFLARFRAEARVMVELQDPNVVQLYEYYEDVLEAAIVMELVDGVALRGILSEHGSTSPEAALTVLKGSLLGLAFAHSAGVVHRDYKPENVLIQADGGSKLADFGIAAHIGEAGGIAGTPAYMAPEQWEGAPASTATDVYAATCVFFECLTGRRPYLADHRVVLMHRHRHEPIPVEEVPSSVRGLVTRGMAKNPVDRPRSARAFLEELEAAAQAAYGPEWEQRGRRHLAELATLLALAFPLAKPAPKAGSSVAQTVLGRVGRVRRVRRPRLGPRTLAGLGVITVAMTAGVIAANRPQDRLSADTIFTPPPSSAMIEETPAQRRRSQVSAPPEPSPGPGRPSGGAAARRPGSPSNGANPGQVTSPPSQVPSSTRTVVPSSPSTPSPPSPTGSQPPPPLPTRTRTPAPTRPPTPTPVPTSTRPPVPDPTGTGAPGSVHTVSGLRVVGIDAHGTTVGFRASTTGNVAVTVTFAEGPDRDRLVRAASRTSVIGGLRTYSHTVPHTFTAPACGQTLYRRVTVSTVPRSSGGTAGRTERVRGEPCAPPAVSITSFDGTTVGFRVKTSGPSAVTVRLEFAQRLGGTRETPGGGTRELELSGDTEYEREVTGEFADPPRCGGYVTRLVTITTVPEGDTPSRAVRIDLPSCAPDPGTGPDSDSDADAGPDTGPAPDTGTDPDTDPGPREPRNSERPTGDEPGLVDIDLGIDLGGIL